MSTAPTLVTQELFQYLTAHIAPEDGFLVRLKEAATEAGIPEIWISAEQGAFMQILLRLTRARRVVEVGTLAGYSAITMARALPDDGHLTTVEINEEYADFAASWVEKGDLQDKVEILRGNATEVLPELEADSYDAAFVDADKANYGVYLQESLRLLRPGGLVMIDNAFAFGKLLDESAATDDVWAIRQFNDLMARETLVASVIVPVGDGMWVGVVDD